MKNESKRYNENYMYLDIDRLIFTVNKTSTFSC